MTRQEAAREDQDRAVPAPKSDGVPGLGAILRLIDELQGFVDALHHRYFSGHKDAEERIASNAAEGAPRGRGLLDTLRLILARALSEPRSVAEHYARFASLALDGLGNRSTLEPEPGDRRFKDESWRSQPFFKGLLQVYLAWEQTLHSWARSQDFSPSERQRVEFILGQITSALSPSNLPINPSALKRAESTHGESAVNGIRQFIDDALHRRGMPQQVLPDAYRLGEHLAITPGSVVLRTPHLELLQYSPQTPTVHQVPILVIPAQINKYYIFDLRPANSLVNYLVQQGLQVFMLSWRNPSAENRDWDLDSYLRATLQAISAVRGITSSPRLGLISACAGGLTALALLGYLAMHESAIVSHHSLLVTAALPGNGSILELFATPEAMEIARSISHTNGTMDGRELGRIFTWLRPRDLVWNYWVNNILMGRSPPPLDVLYWDNDSTLLPAALHGDFIDMVQRRVFEIPNRLRALGTEIDFGRVDVDGYFVGGREDTLMPWRGVYRTARQFRGRHRFVLSTSGHVQSLLRPPRLGGTEFFSGDDVNRPEEEWLSRATRHEGSWWPDWAQWLRERSGATESARPQLGGVEFPPLDAAPGRYVHQRIP